MRTLLTVEAGALALLLMLLAVGAAPAAAWPVAAALGVAGMWPIDARPAARYAAMRLVRLLRPLAPATSMPEPDLHSADDSDFAVRRHGPTVTCALTVWAPATGPHHPGRLADRGPDLDIVRLAALLDRFGITLAGIDVLAIAEAPSGDGPLAAAYRSLCGPLPPIGPHTTAVLVHLDPRRCPDAVARRGGGRAGAARAVRTAAERIRRELLAAGLAAAAVDASGFRALWRQAYQVPTRTDSVSVRAGWEQVHTPAGRHHVRIAAPEVLTTTGLGRVWRTDAAATVLAVRLRPGTGGRVRLTAAHRHLVADVHAPPIETGFRPLRGAGPAGFEMTGPCAAPSPAWGADRPAITVCAATALSLPVGGRPVLLGGTRSGDPVALVLTGPSVAELYLSVAPDTALRLIGRILGAGVALAVRTDRPEPWHRFLRLAPKDERIRVLEPGEVPASGCAGVVYDGVSPGPAVAAGPTRIVLVGPGEPAPPTGPAVVTIGQRECGTDLVVTTAGRKTTVVAVAVPAENRLVEQFMARQG